MKSDRMAWRAIPVGIVVGRPSTRAAARREGSGGHSTLRALRVKGIFAVSLREAHC